MPKVWDLLGHWRVPSSSEADLAHADVILTHEFGDQINVSKTTRSFVEIAAALAKKHDLPMICQTPGHIVAKEHGVNPIKVIERNELQAGGYLDTDEVNRQAAQLCRVRGWIKVIPCTHPHHLWRVGENLRHHGLTPMYADMSAVPYDYSLIIERPFLSNPLLWMPREIMARVMYVNNGCL